MEYREHRPGAPLSELFECLWSLDGDFGAESPLHPVLPDGCAEVVLHLGEPFASWGPQGLRHQPRAVLVGPLERALWLRPPPHAASLGIRFRPGRLGAWLAASRGMTGRVIALEHVLGARSREWLRVLDHTPRESRLECLEQLLRAMPPVGFHFDPLATAGADLLLRARGTTRIEAVATACGLGPRQLARRFEASVGLGPKLFARMARVHAAVEHVHTGADLATAALRAGYADHAHFTRDFGVLAGLPPRRFGLPDRGLGAHFTSPERLLGYFLAGT